MSSVTLESSNSLDRKQRMAQTEMGYPLSLAFSESSCLYLPDHEKAKVKILSNYMLHQGNPLDDTMRLCILILDSRNLSNRERYAMIRSLLGEGEPRAWHRRKTEDAIASLRASLHGEAQKPGQNWARSQYVGTPPRYVMDNEITGLMQVALSFFLGALEKAMDYVQLGNDLRNPALLPLANVLSCFTDEELRALGNLRAHYSLRVGGGMSWYDLPWVKNGSPLTWEGLMGLALLAEEYNWEWAEASMEWE